MGPPSLREPGGEPELDWDESPENGEGHAGTSLPERRQERSRANPGRAGHGAAAQRLDGSGMSSPGPEGRAAADGETPAPPERKTAGSPAMRGRLERKEGGNLKPFTRLITRPETNVAAATAAGGVPVERVISSAGQDAAVPSGRQRAMEDPSFSPNRLQNVIDEALTHSPLTWLDHLGKVRAAVLASLLVGAMGLLAWRFGREVEIQSKGTHIRMLDSASASAGEEDGAAGGEGLESRKKTVLAAFEKFHQSPDTAEKLNWVLEPERVEGRMREYYGTRGGKDPVLTNLQVGTPSKASGGWWYPLSGQEEDGSTVTVLMRGTAEGIRLDWENYVAYGSMPWGQFLNEKPSVPQSLRVRIRPGRNFVPPYESGTHLCYEISHRGSAEKVLAYVEKTSRTGQLMAARPEEASPGWQPANLYLVWRQRTDPSAGGQSVEIVDLIRNNWLDSAGAGAPSEITPAGKASRDLNGSF